MSAAARDNDEAGLVILHHACRWFVTRVSVLPHQARSTPSSRDSTSGTELQSLGNVHPLEFQKQYVGCHLSFM